MSVARAFRHPSLIENFQSLSTPISPTQSIALLGNTALDPEEMLSFELGYYTLLFERLRLRVDLFYNQLDRLFAPPLQFLTSMTSGLPLMATAAQFMNVGDGEVFGGEVGLDFFITPWLKGFGNYSYQERTGDIEIMGFAPHHKGNAGLTASFSNRLSATLLVHYMGEFDTPTPGVNPYTIVNLRLGYRFKLFQHDAEVSIQAFNLFDDVHREVPSGDLMERRVSGTIRYQF